ncbi:MULTISPECIES: hypothetical protein, partial [unclassified Acinetobacter]
MKICIKNQVGARFKLIARKADLSISKESAWGHNKVLDTGLDRMSAGTWIDRCCVGAGNSTPLNSQVALDNLIASTTTIFATELIKNTVTPYYYGVRLTWRFAQGVAAGNLSEVGLGWGNANLWNRSLIKDSSGEPTTITVLADEFLDVVSEIRIYLPETISGSFNLTDKDNVVLSSHNFIGIPVIMNPYGIFSKVGIGGINEFGANAFTGSIGANITIDPTG